MNRKGRKEDQYGGVGSVGEKSRGAGEREKVDMDWGFIILSVASAVFFVQIVMEYNRQSNHLRPQIQRIENEAKGQISERDKYIEMSDGLKARIAEIDTELSQLEKRRAELEKIIQSRLPEDGEGSKLTSS